MFFPEEFTGATRRMAERAALGMCGDCPVRVDCLADALREEPTVDQVFGIRGGLTADQRRTLTAAIAHPAPAVNIGILRRTA
jgi:hypothetical protein